MNVMTNCSYFRSGHLCLPRFVGAGPHRHLQRHPRHGAALLLLLLVREPLAGREPLEARVFDGGREVSSEMSLSSSLDRASLPPLLEPALARG